MEDKNQTTKVTSQYKKTKKVRNRSGHKIELLVNGKIVVFMPGKVTEVPSDFSVPSGLGLYVR